MYDANSVSYTIDVTEYAYNTDKPSITPSCIKANVPALMPNIAIANPTTSKVSINRTMLVNDSSCKPSMSSVATTQNYITITKWTNEHPSYPNKDDGKGLCVRFSKFMIDINNGDIRNMHIKGNI